MKVVLLLACFLAVVYSDIYKKLYSDGQCRAGGAKRLGDSVPSLDACAAICRETSNCHVFIYGKNKKSGKCWWEKSKSNDCSEGFKKDNDYDTYQLDRAKANKAKPTHEFWKKYKADAYCKSGRDKTADYGTFTKLTSLPLCAEICRHDKECAAFAYSPKKANAIESLEAKQWLVF